jgi:serine/threonine protein phosphatase 1
MIRLTRPIAIVGDIHGEVGKLLPALDFIESVGRFAVFVGDYINRGRETQQVLNVLANLRKQQGERHVFLRGNHDHALLQWLEGGSPDSFLRHGGLATVSSYFPRPPATVLEDFLRSFPPEHYDFLASTVPYFEEPELLVSHTGYDPSDPGRRDLDAMVLGRNPLLLTEVPPKTQKLTVFGHFVQDSRRPLDREGLLCLDTGCGTLPDGRLTVLLLPERHFMQF